MIAPGGEGGGGGSGAYSEVYVSGVVSTPNYYTGTVGQGGAGMSNTPAVGGDGTATTFSGSGSSANYQGSNVSSTGGVGAAGIVIVYEYR